jgi:uncharacterized membrane protein
VELDTQKEEPDRKKTKTRRKRNMKTEEEVRQYLENLRNCYADCKCAAVQGEIAWSEWLKIHSRLLSRIQAVEFILGEREIG